MTFFFPLSIRLVLYVRVGLQKYIAAKQNAEGEGGSGKRKEHRGGDTNDSAARGGSEESARTGAAAAGAGAAAAASVPMRRGAAPSAADLAAFEAARPLLPWKIKAPLLFAVLLVSGFLGWAVMGLIAVCCYLMYEFTDGSGTNDECPQWWWWWW